MRRQRQRPAIVRAGLALGVLLAGLVPAAAHGDSGWTIREFNVLLAIQPDRTLDVTETIDANFEVSKHGIYRDIPIRYAVGMHQYALPFHLLGVDDGSGNSHPTQVSNFENRVQIRIGEAARVLQGPVRYRIRYRVLRAILQEGNRAWEKDAHARAVLRWVAAGTEWGVPVEKTVVTVALPRDLDDSQVTYDAWTGAYGAKNKDFVKRRIDAHTLAFETGRFRPGEGITVEVAMPGDAVAASGWARELSWWLLDNFPYAIFPLTLALCWAGWFYRGRDLPGQGTIVVNYEPPDGLGPAEVGTLIDERVDLRDITASIIDLAVRGYLKITEVGTKSWFSSKVDYQFTRLKQPTDLKPFEKKLWDSIFGSEDTVLLSSLETKLYSVISSIKRDLYRRLSKDRYFDGSPPSVTGTYLLLGLLIVAVLLGLAALFQQATIGRMFMLPILITGLLSAAAVWLTSLFMPRKTRKGRIAWEKIRGLEEYIRRAEVDDISAQERQGIFERLLPYAIVFRLTNRWAKAFADLYTQPPEWYQPVDGSDFATWQLMRNVDRSLAAMNQTFVSMPRSSGVNSIGGPTGAGYNWSSGGFSSGGSGGGFSGGGFGGGGGGSW
jgi:uncharacterized membrane protein YgcG